MLIAARPRTQGQRAGHPTGSNGSPIAGIHTSTDSMTRELPSRLCTSDGRNAAAGDRLPRPRLPGGQGRQRGTLPRRQRLHADSKPVRCPRRDGVLPVHHVRVPRIISSNSHGPVVQVDEDRVPRSGTGGEVEGCPSLLEFRRGVRPTTGGLRERRVRQGDGG